MEKLTPDEIQAAPAGPEWYVVTLGAIRIGAVPMPATTQLTERDIAYRIGRADAEPTAGESPAFARFVPP